MNPLHFEKIFKTIWEMKKLHYAETTIAVTDRRLKLIAKTANLNNPEMLSIKVVLPHSPHINSLANSRGNLALIKKSTIWTKRQ